MEEPGFFAVIRNDITDPYVRLVAAIISVGIADCLIKPDSTNRHNRRYELQKKKDGIDFIKSKYFDYLVNLAGLDIKTDAIRKLLKKDLDKRDDIAAMLRATYKGYPEKRKKQEKAPIFASLPEPICNNIPENYVG